MADHDDWDNEGNKAKCVVNQPYDETLDVNEEEEVASTFTPSPRPALSRGGVRGSMTDQSEDEFNHDEDLVESKPVGGGGAEKLQNKGGQLKGKIPSDEEGDDQSDSSDDEDDEDGQRGTLEGAYDPAEYEHLPVGQDIKELFQYITRYTPQSIDLEFKLKPFIPDFIPAVGDIDAFLKVSKPDGKPEALGLTVLDEPCAKQSDPTVLGLQLITVSKQTSKKSVAVKSIDDPEKNPKAISNWIESIGELHRQKPPPTVHYQRNMPDIDTLMQEWPPEFEELLNQVGLPTAELDVDLPQYVDLVCGMLDIPVQKNRIHSLHVLFTLYSEFKNSQHFNQLAKDNNLDNALKTNGAEVESNTMTFE
ncbi:intraflagellar transport protein 46 homolog isoform X2 [Dendronephthya gigantea]|uniref:intraflagellar transport protein 46 homolog isoform X2 n=1 Tax=Dendronephthya gigantea TaxID=151771 RepID=UPI00106BD6E0|nr:intraflagellar transport protein 46 homolog isoform X2 [Dendronephthya gigantea]